MSQILQTMPADREVRIIVANWLPQPTLPMAADSRREAMIQQTRAQEASVLQALRSAGEPAAEGTPLRLLPLTIVRTTAAAARQLSQTNPAAQVYIDEPRYLDLNETTKIIGSAEANRHGLTGKDQVVAVIDSGVDTAHPFLKDTVIAEYCVSGACPNGQEVMAGPGAARPVSQHGTHVAGIIAGHGDKFTGVAPDAKIIMINAFVIKDGEPVTSDSRVLVGFDILLSLKVDSHVPITAINLSLGGGAHASPCVGLYEWGARGMREAGMIVVASSGNDHYPNMMGEPACAPHVLSVGAIDKQGRIPDFSDSAAFLSILAPGASVLSSVGAPGKVGFEAWNGTSMAAPHVVGALALVRQAMPDASPEELVRALTAGAPTVTDPRNGISTPVLRIPPKLYAAAPPPPAAALPAPAAPAPAAAAAPAAAPAVAPAAPPAAPPSNWGAITQ